MKIAVVTPLMKSGETGGAEALYSGLVRALRAASYDAHPVEVLIDESTFDGILESYTRCYDLDLNSYDLVISTKAPTFMVQHPNHISYLLHTLRVFYDMFEREYGAGTPEQRKQRKLIHRLDQEGLHPNRIRKHFANGHQTFLRLHHVNPFWREIRFQALHHPPELTGFHPPRRGAYVFLPSRLHRWKRVDLVIQAYKYLNTDIPLKIAGTGEDEAALRELARHDPRIEFLGRVSDAELLDLYASALVVPFVPQAEDYGLVTIEAFKSSKPVITCVDSGEPTYFVQDYKTGRVVEPRPQAIAQALEYFITHPDEAVQMGKNGYAAVEQLNWESLVARLVADTPYTENVNEGTPKPSYPRHAGPPPPQVYHVAVLDMQPIEPPIGGGRIRLLGLYHGLGENLPTTYVGTYDWRGEKYRRHRHSPTLEEITIPLRAEHLDAAEAWAGRAGGKNVIDVSFDILARLSPEYVEAARQVASRADIVVFSHPWVYPLVKDVLRPSSQLIVYDSQNVEGLLRMTLLDDGAFGTQLVKHVVQVEAELCRFADLIFACSHEDREVFHDLYDVPFSKILIVPNGTFTQRIAPADEAARHAAKQKLGLGEQPLTLFVGSAYPPNVQAAEFICNQLAPALPDITFAICGGVGDALDSATFITRANVCVTGYQSEEDKFAYVTAADLAINPMFSGSGTNIKMFDYMAAGLPIVSTPIGVRGIASGPETAFEVCPESEFAQRIQHIVQDRENASALGQAARHLAEQKYSWERISAQLGLQLYRQRAQLTAPRPFFSVIVATFERHETLTALANALRAQSFRDFEVIVVDQSRTPWNDRERYPDLDLYYIHTDVRGAVSARNTAASFARGQVLAFTDDDCQPLPDWLESARRYFDDASIVGVEGLIVSERRNDPKYRVVTNIGFEGQGFMTANLFLRRETFMALDGFDERFDHPHFREDTDLGWRACAHGSIPFAHDVRVYHPPHLRTNARESAAERSRFFEKDALLLAKHPERYRTLFLNEAHYEHTPGFGEHFLRGAEKYGVAVDNFYLERIAKRKTMNTKFGDSRDQIVDDVVSLLRSNRDVEPGEALGLADAFFAYRLLLRRNPDLQTELLPQLATHRTFREFLSALVNSHEFSQFGGLFPPNRVLMAELEGLRFWFNTSDREMGVLMALGQYEPHIVELIKRRVQPGMTCLDIGAQSGFYTCLMAQRVGALGKVYAMEPMPASFELLRKNVEENHFQTRVELFPLAASDVNGSLETSLVSNMYVAGQVDGAERTQMEAIRLDDLIRVPVDFIKMDIEGHEPAALAGMRELILRSKPIIISEANEYWLRTCAVSSASEYIDSLIELGYQVCNVARPDEPIARGSLALDVLDAIDVIALPLKTKPKSKKSHPTQIPNLVAAQ